MLQSVHSFRASSLFMRVKRHPVFIILVIIALFISGCSNPEADKAAKSEQPTTAAPADPKQQTDKAVHSQTDNEVALLTDPALDCSSYDATLRIGFGVLKDGYHFSFNSWDMDGNHGLKCVLMISCIQDSSWLSAPDESDMDAQKKVLEKLKPIIPRIVKDKQTAGKIIADLKPENISKRQDEPLGWFVHTKSDRYNSIDVKINYQEFFLTITVYCSGF